MNVISLRGLVDRQVKFFKNSPKSKSSIQFGKRSVNNAQKRYRWTYNMQYFLFSQKELSNLNALKMEYKTSVN